MKKIILVLVLLAIISGCAQQKPAGEQEQAGEKAQTANPASVYCEEQAGTLRMEENESGQYGVCTLEDGTECEEWAYFRGECAKKPAVPGNASQPQEEPVQKTEEIDVVDRPSNKICKKLPLSNDLSPGDRFYCLAVVNKNPKFCEMIETDNAQDLDAIKEKNLCLAHAKQDVSYCKKITDALGKRTCYFGLSLISGNIDICDGIDYDKDLKQLCHFSFVNTLYWEDKSDRITLAHCNKLPEPDRSTCLAYKEGDVSLCKNNVNCLTFFEQPMSFCTTGKGRVLEYCIRDRAMTGKNLSICETLTGEKRDDCIGDFAGHISQDVSTCDMLSGDAARNTCYKDVAVQSGWLKG